MQKGKISVIDLENSYTPTREPNSDTYVDEKIGRIIQVNLAQVRCAECNYLLMQASTGSVVSVICQRCRSFNIVQVK